MNLQAPLCAASKHRPHKLASQLALDLLHADAHLMPALLFVCG